MQTIDQNRLRGILVAAETTFITLVANTDPRMVKKDRQTGEPNPYLDRVVKVSKVNGIINWSYSNSVNNQRMREASPLTVAEAEAVPVFEPLARTWGEKAKGIEIGGIMIELGNRSPFIDHNDTVYLEVKCERAIEVVYLLDGEPCDVEILRPYLPLRKGESKRQEVEREVVLRDYKLTNIKELRIYGELYLVA